MMKKIRKQTKIDEKKMKFKNENIHDFENFENNNANNDQWIFVDWNYFNRVVLNEVQKIKTIKFLIIKQIMQFNVFLRTLLNATFIINKTFDFYELLRILWNDDFKFKFDDKFNIDRYDVVKWVLINQLLTLKIIKKHQ